MTRSSKTVSIANGASLSSAIQLGAGVPLALFMPAAFTGTSITFQVSADGSTFGNLYDASGNEIAVTVAASVCVSLEAVYLAGIQYLKIRSGTAGSPTAEGAARELTLVTRQERD